MFHRFVPEDEAIDLINVAFEQKPPLNSFQNKDRRKTKLRQGNARQVAMETPKKFDVPDRLTGISGLEELQRQNPTRQWNFIEVKYLFLLQRFKATECPKPVKKVMTYIPRIEKEQPLSSGRQYCSPEQT